VAMLQKLAERLRLWIAPPVPTENSRCEFDCRRLNCTFTRYERCRRRQRHAEQIKAYQQPTDS